MVSDKELLEDISFIRKVVPKDAISDLLYDLLRKKAFNEKSAILLSEYSISIENGQIDRLITEDRIRFVSDSPIKVYLTGMGKIIACGEYAIRQQEKKKN